ncbi:MAG TPA: hypothetical protein HA222_01655 [Candidatus Diapherotrites archaeon]|nr:hypothetical protein [Candidatus Diapherotrites archaeon]
MQWLKLVRSLMQRRKKRREAKNRQLKPISSDAEKLRKKFQPPNILARLYPKAFVKIILKNHISFETSDGKKVQILRNGFLNIGKSWEKLGVKPRALVIVLVDGKKLYFYRSSGEASGRPGEWFPTFGLIDYGEPYNPGTLVKMKGHEGVYLGEPTSFPQWVDEISRQLKIIENQLSLHQEWNIHTFEQIAHGLNKIPYTDQLKVGKSFKDLYPNHG